MDAFPLRREAMKHVCSIFVLSGIPFGAWLRVRSPDGETFRGQTLVATAAEYAKYLHPTSVRDHGGPKHR